MSLYAIGDLHLHRAGGIRYARQQVVQAVVLQGLDGLVS